MAVWKNPLEKDHDFNGKRDDDYCLTRVLWSQLFQTKNMYIYILFNILDICIETKNPYQSPEIKSVCGQCTCFTCSTLKLMGKYD